MPEGRGLLTASSTWYCNQRTLEVTAETGFRTSFCQKIILMKAINFTSYSSAWAGFPTPKHKNNNIELSFINLNIRVCLKVTVISAENVKSFRSVFSWFIYCRWADEFWANGRMEAIIVGHLKQLRAGEQCGESSCRPFKRKGTFTGTRKCSPAMKILDGSR